MGQKLPKPKENNADPSNRTNKNQQAPVPILRHPPDSDDRKEKAPVNWVSSVQGRIPKGAVKAGRDLDGGPIFVGRMYYRGHFLPAKICPMQKCAIAGFDGREVNSRIFEVLVCEDYSWKPARDGYVPKNALASGETPHGETIYIGRAPWNGTLTPGKVQPSFGCLLIPWGGFEVAIRDYAVLTVKNGNGVSRKGSNSISSDRLRNSNEK